VAEGVLGFNSETSYLSTLERGYWRGMSGGVRGSEVYVGDDGKIADMTQVTHGSTLEKAAGRLPAEK
jgi:hypothetical protein